ncbi:Multidrug resistance protein homolog 49 [Eumeta japonica]|uniref:Multidrug resistance protein homolog 49 n=1 Tax=Eumeta variegata TaxID=151549 RepID=A0A4C1SY47_EUMVA|nr:Multidrug resistance protein homolog 49 [Eumeta japonica]
MGTILIIKVLENWWKKDVISEKFIFNDSTSAGPRFSEASLDKNILQILLLEPIRIPWKDVVDEQQSTQYLENVLACLQWARPEWKYLAIATICALLYGCAQPAFAFVFADLFGSLNDEDPDVVLSNTGRSAIIAIAVGIVAGWHV